MDVERPSGPSKPEYQTAWSILVFRVVLYHLAERDRFTDLLDIDSAQNTLVDGMPGELKLTLRDPVANLMDNCHKGIIYSGSGSIMLWTACRSSGIGGIGNCAADCCAHQTLVAIPRNRLLVSEKG